jgi:hypothetical protein
MPGGRVSRSDVDRGSLTAGAVLIGYGTLVLLDRVGTLDLRFGYFWPLLFATIGGVLLSLGLTKGRRR